MIGWARRHQGGYECSSKGDTQFSALHARMADGRTIEEWYQCDIKGYDIGGTNWQLGKGKPPLVNYPDGHLYEMYLSLWRLWAIRNHILVSGLRMKVGASAILTDCFASTDINQARALAQILNEWF